MKAVVLGAGATGLSLAYLLSLNSADVVILEAASEAGGLLATFDPGGGHRLERFYHHFFTHDAEIHWLLSELGLQNQVIYRPTTMGLYRHGRVYPFNGARDLLALDCLRPSDRLRFGLSSALLAFLPGYSACEDQTAMEWFRTWMGKSATEAIWEPLLRVKFGEAAERITLAWMAGRLRQRARSRSGTREELGYLRGSLQVLVDRLLEVLTARGVEIRLGTEAESLQMAGEAVTGVRTARGSIAADVVVSTIPTPVLARLLERTSCEYADALSRIRYVGALCTVLALDRQLSPVYWLNITESGYDFGGVIEQTNFMPSTDYGGKHILYLSRYLPEEHKLWRIADAELLPRQLDQLDQIFQTRVRDYLLDHWVFRGRFAAPVCDLGFSSRIPKFRSPIPNLHVASMCHVYPDERGTNNSIRVAAEAIRALGLDSGMVPSGFSLAGKYGH